MPMVPYVTDTYLHRSENVSACRTFNFYVEQVPADKGKVQSVLIGTPGIKLFCDVGANIDAITRGMYYTSGGELIVAIGTKIYQVLADGTATDLMDIAAGSSRVSMVDNGWWLTIVDGASMWCMKLTDKSDIRAIDCQTFTPIKVAYLGKRIVLIDGTEDYRWSDIGDDGSLTFDPLNVDSADSFADPIISCAVVRNELWLFGPRSYEVRRLTQDATYPFQIIGGSAGEIGCGAADSVATIGESVFWLGSSSEGQNVIFQSQGYSAVRISNHAIEYLLGTLRNTSDAFGWTYQMEGHQFYILTFEQGDRTLCYDATNGTWTERGSRDPLKNQMHKWRPKFASYTSSGILLGSSEGPYILKLDLDYYEEFDGRSADGTPADPDDSTTFNTIPIQRIHQSPHYWDALGVVSIDEFDLDISAGAGLQSGQGSDPQVMMQLSKDGGHTYGSEHWRSFGAIGDYAKRVAWRMLGRARSLVIRITIADPVKVIISGGRLITAKMGERAR